jgi:hypothetical protein
MPAAAPRLHPALVERLERLARSEMSFAEIRRAVVTRARELDVPPPSYEHVRRIVTSLRMDAAEAHELRDIALGVALGTKHGNELVYAMRRRADGRDS